MGTSLAWVAGKQVTVLLSVEGPKPTMGLGRTHPPTSQWQLCVSGIPCRELLTIPADGLPSQTSAVWVGFKAEAVLAPVGDWGLKL